MRLRNVPGSRDEIDACDFCIHDPIEAGENWKQVFHNDAPLHIEIGMGKGRFIMDMADLQPDTNFVGIEMYSSVLVRAIRKAAERYPEGPEHCNIRFIRMDARNLCEYFEKGQVGKIYLNFSDPWPKERHAGRRLTSTNFLKIYEKVLMPGAVVEFKTDNRSLFDFSLEQLELAGWVLDDCTFDLYRDEVRCQNNVMTEYEEKFHQEGIPICKLIAHPNYE